MGKYADILKSMIPPAKQAALPYLKLRLSTEQLKSIAADIMPGGRVPFSMVDVQNWTKRGYIAKGNKNAKQYTPSEAATLLLFADLKNIVGLDGATALLQQINGDPGTDIDDNVDPVRLFEQYAKVCDSTATRWEERLDERLEAAKEVLAQEGLDDEAKERLSSALVVMTLIAQANLYREIALRWLSESRQ